MYTIDYKRLNRYVKEIREQRQEAEDLLERAKKELDNHKSKEK